MLKKPQNVYLPIDKFQAKVFKKNEGERSEWVTKFALALAEEAEEPFAKELLNRAQADLYKDIVRGWRFNARRSLESSGIKDPTDKQVHEKCIDEYGDEYVEAMELLKASSKRIKAKALKMENDESTAGAPTREDGEDRKSGTPATISQDAAHRKAADDSKAPTSCNLAYAGKNGLVRLTDDEYALLLQELGNKRKADRLIDDLDYKLAEGATFRQPHLHVLTHWQSYREDKAAEAAEMAKVNADARAEAYSKRGYKTAEERQQEELAKINDFCTGLRNGTIKIAKEG
ncbi:MAG: hypothetical protein J6U20_10130 [Fibrobacter sp.]|nr:hypothetical protein [Fibrobacter sp.]